MTPFDDKLLRAALAPLRELEPSDGEVAEVLSRTRNGRRRRDTWTPSRLAAAATVFMALLVGGGYAVPATRAALEDAFDAFFGDHAEPGRALRPEDDAPRWLRDGENGGYDQRLIAESEGYRLYSHREKEHALCFDLDTSVGICDSIAGWHRQFDEHAVVVLGPGGGDVEGRARDSRGRRPLFGVTARSVHRVELRYQHGPPLAAERLQGGFVLLADASRRPREIAGFDARGRELERVDVRYIDWNAP